MNLNDLSANRRFARGVSICYLGAGNMFSLCSGGLGIFRQVAYIHRIGPRLLFPNGNR